jgi:LuxR family transcriptional activator of bioluminescence operon
MDSWIKPVIERLQACTDLGEFKAILIDMRKQLGFEHFLYGVRLSNAFTSIDHFVVSDYPEVWLGEYMSNN